MGDRPMAAHLEAIDKTKMSKVCKINYVVMLMILAQNLSLTKPPN